MVLMPLSPKKLCIADLLGLKAKGALVRSKSYANGCPIHILFSFGNKNGRSRYIHSLRSENGQELTAPSEIRQRAVRFYNELNGSEYEEDEEMSVSFYAGLSKLQEKSKAVLEALV